MSVALFVFSQNEKFYKEFEVKHVPRSTLSGQWGPFCGLRKGASLGKYFRKDIPLQADELEMQSMVFHEWIEPLCKAKGIACSGPILSQWSRCELNFAHCAVGL